MKLPIDGGALLTPSVSIQLEAHACYRALIPAASERTAEPGLGGNLLYAGELDADGRAMTVAGNVAGCASLAVTASSAAQKQANRDGVIDFAVTSLDEALRILKNEIRKHNSVAVCIGSDRDRIEPEMIERGVLPDLVFAGSFDLVRETGSFAQHSRQVTVEKPDGTLAVLAWHVAHAPARWMPKLDAIAMECMKEDPWAGRWIRLSPRYLGRAALGERAFWCEPQAATEIIRRFGESVNSGAIASEVSIALALGGDSNLLRLQPAP